MGRVSSRARLARTSRARRWCSAWTRATSSRCPATSRRRRMARPPPSRPSASTLPPASVRTMMLNGRPLANSASSAILRARAGARLQPLAEAQEAIGAVGQARHPLERLGDDAQGLVLRPRDQDLRLGADDRIGGSKAAPQVGALAACRLRLAPRPPRREPGEHKSEDDHAADDGDHRKLPQGQPETSISPPAAMPAHERQHAGDGSRP